MKPLRLLAASALCALGLAGCASGPDEETAGRLYWMVGCWQSEDGVNTINWQAPTAGVMFGNAVTVRDGQLAFFEQNRVDFRRGKAIYTSSPEGQRPVDFFEADAPAPAATPAEGERPRPSITFENPEQDYPQRITYRSLGEKGLAAHISQLDGSRPADYVWIYCKN
jgi:hypothetical protein